MVGYIVSGDRNVLISLMITSVSIELYMLIMNENLKQITNNIQGMFYFVVYANCGLFPGMGNPVLHRQWREPLQACTGHP